MQVTDCRFDKVPLTQMCTYHKGDEQNALTLMNAIITGGTKGIGRAIAQSLASAGYHLFLCARNEVDLYTCVGELQTMFPAIEIKALPIDVAEKVKAQSFGAWVLKHDVSIDVLVNNAGSFLPGNISEEADGVFEEMINVNLASAYHLTRILLPKMIEQRSGHIFNMCSVASLHAYKNGGSYSISKYALKGFSDNLREELMDKNIKVTSVFPGAVYTRSWEGSGVDKQRIMEANDIAELVVAALKLSARACVEQIVVRPQLGDL
jgi:short-subunit dehydrogenase